MLHGAGERVSESCTAVRAAARADGVELVFNIAWSSITCAKVGSANLMCYYCIVAQHLVLLRLSCICLA